jgi:uncharacterized protein DUF3326
VIIHQREITLPAIVAGEDIFEWLKREVQQRLPGHAIPLRFAVTKSIGSTLFCEVAAIEADNTKMPYVAESIFEFVRRDFESASSFTCVLIVPTGVGAEIGGHAGDAGPVARLIGEVCDRLITHPNVVNASDINELPENGLYVEGSVITRLLMGTVALQLVRSNRVLVVLGAHADESFVSAAINSVSAARACYGLTCPRVVVLDQPFELIARYSGTGAAVGEILGLDRLCRVLDTYKGEYDAVAISSVIEVPPSAHMDYFLSHGTMVNPWGGVEAILTHAVTGLYNVPSAHSPMLESAAIANEDPGVVDPRMAAEAVSVAFLQCVLKGLQRSPRIASTQVARTNREAISASDISCVVVPVGCLGLPTLAALAQGIPVIAVRENRNVMLNDLEELPWSSGKFFLVDNYWEAVGVLASLKAGIAPESTRRPLQGTIVSGSVLRDSAPAPSMRNPSRQGE